MSPTAHVLVLGGTAWLGRTVARHALALGHEVTCLARGDSGDVPDGATLLRADRSTPGAYAALPAAAAYDLVVDVSWQPAFVREALAALSDRAAHWVYVSSGSVYADHSRIGGGLELPLLPALAADRATGADYGSAKVACEEAVASARGEAALVARSGLIAGAGDPSDRFGYWVGRHALALEDGGPVLVPEALERGAQYLDVEDLAAWIVSAGLAGTTGTVDAYGPRRTLGDIVEVAARVARDDASLQRGDPVGEVEQVALPDEVLRRSGVEEYMGARSLALWMTDPDWLGFSSHDDSSGVAAGVRARPLEQTIRAALAWERTLGLGRTGRGAGLDRDDELSLVASWRGR